jgi:TonB-dependent starch-binding outer membrane protein SusC
MRKLTVMLLVCLMAIGQAWAQTRAISGKITDEKGDPIAGASVTVKGTNVGTTTDDAGNFTLNVPTSARTLTISSVNYRAVDLAIGNRTNFDASLAAQSGNLDEVVVTAYGTTKKPEVTGAINKVTAAQIENRPFTSVDKALQGQVPGLQAVSSSGQPGAATDIRIRGFSSITAGNSPLWVVDGIPILSGDASRQTTTANLLSTLNPNDIESLSVLKDASATALYGSLAANGVILVTTKSGKSGKTKFTFDTEVGYSDKAYENRLYTPLNAEGWFDLTRDGLINAGIANAGNVNAIMASNFGFGNGQDFNWLENTTRRGTQQNYNISMSGGNDKTTFSLSGGYFQQEGITIQSDFKRYSAALNMRHKVNNKFTVFLTSNLGVIDQIAPLNGGAFGNPVLSSYFLLPSRNAYRPDGSYNIVAPDFGPGSLHNTIYTANIDKRELQQNTIRGTIGGEYEIIKGLKFTTRYGMDYNVLEEDQYNNPFHGDGFNVGGRAFFAYTRYTNWTWTNMLDYRRALTKSEDLTMDVKVGYESRKSTGVFGNAGSQGFPPNTALTVPSVGAQPVQAARTGSDFAFVAAPFTQIAFNWKDRYVVNGSYRRDGSSRFGINNQWGDFWSVGGTWNIDRESFMENQNIFTQLKLRGSYGSTGNAAIGNYDWRPLYGYGANYNQTTGSTITNAGNPDLTWETNYQLNFGLDFSILRNRISGSIDWYNRISKDILLNVPLPPTVGLGSISRNIGEMENKGIELLLNVVPVQTRDFKWDISFNYSANRNKVTALVPGQNEILAGVFTRTPGYDFQTYFVRLWAGVDPANGDPLWYTDDTKSTTTNNWNLAQRSKEFGSATPRYFGGLTNNLSYKGITLSAQFNYSGGNYLRDTWGGFYNGSGNGGAFGKVVRQQEQRWRQPGDNAQMPRYVYNGNKLAQNFSTFYLFQGDYIRLRDLTLGYNLPKTLISKIGLTSVNIYGRGTNIWTKVKDENMPFDPEQGVSNETNLNVFIPKTFTIGLNLGF